MGVEKRQWIRKGARMSIKNFLEVWGFIDKPKTVEFVADGMLPTAAPGDPGTGWYKVEGGLQRDIRTSPPPENERYLWSRLPGGAWYKKRK
jgi:hypothetical protein